MTNPPANDKPNGGEDFAALFAESEAAEKSHRRVRAGDLVRGRVVALGAQSAFVAIGAKAEAVIDFQKKVAALLQIPLKPMPSDETG